ncbi:translational activator of cytochrome c oxidase 1 [Thalassophryne amazonica]|uniref:translational activator of cytochrome c oxidase 1 n=1 Tax=Thalassophryne amazonica TaxID=390379 RepID=UPI001471E696|nr:translational activator of cytochrome c oxidase 1 [Thalassophryne amazonica]
MAGSAVLGTLRTLVPIDSVLSRWNSAPIRRLQLCSALYAGHNKWSKVKHIKGPKDEERSKKFCKLSMLIRLAVREGGPNPSLNANLAHILEQCRSHSMPKASVETAIKNAEKAKLPTHHLYEARGPGGCSLLIEVLTENNPVTQSEIKRLLLRNGALFSDGVRHNFTKRALVLVQGQDITAERALDLAIEAGAEDVQETQDEEEQRLLQFICQATDVYRVRNSLAELGMQINFAGVEFTPRTYTFLDDTQLEACATLIETISNRPDVIRVWDNIQVES